MITIDKTEVFGWESAIRGMRNPMNSWDKSDSLYMTVNDIAGHPCDDGMKEEFVVGNSDLDLMTRLVKAGSDHSKFMRMINVTCDITAPRYWWAEYDTYKVGTVRNSCSTMHKIHAKEFEIDDFSHDKLDSKSLKVLHNIITYLNGMREWHNNAEPNFKKDAWWQMIQLLPQSYNQKATVQLNYAVLRNMYHSRRTHKLDEWHIFCKWIEDLPYSELIIGENNDNG